MGKCGEGVLWRSVVDKCCGEGLSRSAGKEKLMRSGVKKCWRRVLERSVVEKSCRCMMGRRVGEGSCREVVVESAVENC